jgi:molecular chaperone HtpG
VVNSLGKFDDKELRSVAAADVDLGDSAGEGETLGKEDTDKLCAWLKERLSGRVSEVRAGKRLVSRPAMALQPEGDMSPQMRQMMRAMKQDNFEAAKVILEINPRHAIVRRLAAATSANPDLSGIIAEQLLDSALLSAGLLDDTHDMVGRVEQIMERALG